MTISVKYYRYNEVTNISNEADWFLSQKIVF